MKDFSEILTDMDLEFFAGGKHKTTAEILFAAKDSVFLDVRSTEERESVDFPLKYQAEYIHIPINQIPGRFTELPKEKPIGIFCSAGIRAAIVYAFLRTNGFENVRILVGGYESLMNSLKPNQIRNAVK